MTTADRWRRVRAVFERAVALEPGPRAEFVDAACGDDPELRRQVDALLDADRREGSRLPDDDAVPAWLGAHVGEALTGVRVGPCRLVRLLGAGGMGMVYEAEQDQPRRTVALKLLRPGVGVDARRIELEAEMLASLRHPNIVQVYSGGVHAIEAAGQRLLMPYLVLEPVDRACSLTEYARREGLPSAARIGLFLDVCDAMAHAHHRGLVHRDLKPDNLLVDGQGRVKVIDFGIASASTDRESALAAGTERYMAPEQRDPEPRPSSAAADVFALGVVLDELVPEASGDLRHIVAKAKAEAPEARYADAGQLAQDLRRCLGHFPVLAAPPRRGYVLRRFVRRHRLAVAVGLLVAFGMAVGLVGVSVGWRNADAARREAEGKAAEAEAVVDFLQRAIVAAQPWHEGRDATVLEFLETVAAQLGSEFADRPGVAAALHQTVGWSLRGLGRIEEAEVHLRRALELMHMHGFATPRQELVARYRLATVAVEFGRRDEAAPVLADLAADAERMLGPEDELTLTIRDFWAATLTSLARQDEAARIHEELLAISRRLHGPRDVRTLSRCNNLVNSLVALRRFDDAAGHAEFAVEAMRAQFGGEHPNTQVTIQNLAAVRFHQGRFADAEALSREVLAVRVSMLGEDHPYTVITRYWLGKAVLGQERHAEALAIFEPTLVAARAAFGADHDYGLQLELGIARALRGLSRREEADALLRQLAEKTKATTSATRRVLAAEVAALLASDDEGR